MKLIDRTGMRYGRLVAKKYMGDSKWLCECDCGNTTIVKGCALTTGNTTSCGCLRNEKSGQRNFDDKTGRRFGRLVALEYEGDGFWKCQCDCGNVVSVKGKYLNNGNTKSCGCLQDEYGFGGELDDKTGKRFGRLTAISYVPEKHGWLCKCDCGNEVVVDSHTLSRGDSRSCGCYKMDKWRSIITTHGGTHTRLYGVYKSMIQRTCNPNSPSYKNYGGRGITICDEWLNDFAAFRDWAMANGYDPDAPHGKCTIDRIDNDGNYEPSNCRWVDMVVQCHNQRKRKRNPAGFKPVEQVDADGNVIARYPSIVDASKATGISASGISGVCHGHSKTIYGTIWRLAS